MLKYNKKAQGFGGLITVIVIGIVFFAFFPFLQAVLSDISSTFGGVIGGMITLCIFLPVYFMARFAFNLGAE